MTMGDPGPRFNASLRGYDRAEVDEHVERLEAELRSVYADRDTAAARAAELGSRLAATRSEIQTLREKAAGAAAPTFETIGARIADMLKLAEAEGVEIRRRAHADVAAQREEVARHQAEMQQRQSELDQRTAAMTADARSSAERLVADARARADSILAEARTAADETTRQAKDYARGLRTDAERETGELRAETERDTTALRDAVERHANETRTDADSYSARLRTKADADTQELRSRTEAATRELRSRTESETASYRQQTEAHTAKVLRDTEAQVAAMLADAEQRASTLVREATEHAEALRAAAEKAHADALEDFEVTLRLRRASEAQADAERHRRSVEEAEGRITAAKTESTQLLAAARSGVAELTTIRGQVLTQLTAVRDLLDELPTTAGLGTENALSQQARPDEKTKPGEPQAAPEERSVPGGQRATAEERSADQPS